MDEYLLWLGEAELAKPLGGLPISSTFLCQPSPLHRSVPGLPGHQDKVSSKQSIFATAFVFPFMFNELP